MWNSVQTPQPLLCYLPCESGRSYLIICRVSMKGLFAGSIALFPQKDQRILKFLIEWRCQGERGAQWRERLDFWPTSCSCGAGIWGPGQERAAALGPGTPRWPGLGGQECRGCWRIGAQLVQTKCSIRELYCLFYFLPFYKQCAIITEKYHRTQTKGNKEQECL